MILPAISFSQGPNPYFIYSNVCVGNQLPVDDFSTPNINTNSPIVAWSWEVNGTVFSTQSNAEYLFPNCGPVSYTHLTLPTTPRTHARQPVNRKFFSSRRRHTR